MKYDAIIIGGGLSGLTAASLLAKRGLHVAVVDKNYNPGGTCGIFRRGDVTFDQGAAMLYGFGEQGFNAHRFVFNCLEEPIDIIRHDLLYCVNFKGQRIRFWADVDRFAEELTGLFPSQKDNIARFYRDMSVMYRHVMVEDPDYTSADEVDGRAALKNMMKHPMSYIRFLGYLNKSAKKLLEKYFTDPEIFKFFDKLTSTYCYATVEEAPAILAAVMFVDNHVGGSYYPAGSTLFLPGKLEKVIEEHGGDMLLQQEAVSVLFDGDRPRGVKLENGETLEGDNIIYSGTVWNLYGKLLDEAHTTAKQRAWANSLIPTYPSVVLYATVDRSVIPTDTAPIEMLVGNPDRLDESEVTAYILSIDDHTLCPEDVHTVIAIGPTFENWEGLDKAAYQAGKEREKQRLIAVLEKRFPGISAAVRFAEVATPVTIERYTMKNRGAVAGPKQMLGQHMFRRQHIRTKWDNLYCCGESTVMGTGTPTVTTSGLTAANVLLKKLGKAPFVYEPDRKNYVRIVEHPFTPRQLYADAPGEQRQLMEMAMQCRLCQHPTCSRKADIRGVMRRVAVGNFVGAKKCWEKSPLNIGELDKCEALCRRSGECGAPVQISKVIAGLMK